MWVTDTLISVMNAEVPLFKPFRLMFRFTVSSNDITPNKVYYKA